MSKHLKWAQLCLLSLVATAVAHADHKPGHKDEGMKGLVISGGFEGGFVYDFNSTIKETQWIVDNLHVKMQADISDKVKVVFSNGAAIGKGSSTLGAGINTAAYYSAARLTGGAGSQMILANNAAYVDVAWMDGVNMSVGHFITPFGMESMQSRYDMHTYYYSSTFSKALQTYGWLYDLGMKFTVQGIIPGTFELAVIDDRKAEAITPGMVARYSLDHKMGDMSFNPTVSTFLGRWSGGPKDLGVTAGLGFKMGTLWANAEWVLASQKTPPSASDSATDMSVYLEPGVDLGLAQVSLKGEYYSVKPGAPGASSTNDFNIGAAVSHTYADKYRVRLTYQHMNLGAKLGPHVNDLRVLFGTKW